MRYCIIAIALVCNSHVEGLTRKTLNWKDDSSQFLPFSLVPRFPEGTITDFLRGGGGGDIPYTLLPGMLHFVTTQT